MLAKISANPVSLVSTGENVSAQDALEIASSNRRSLTMGLGVDNIDPPTRSTRPSPPDQSILDNCATQKKCCSYAPFFHDGSASISLSIKKTGTSDIHFYDARRKTFEHYRLLIRQY
jgi:hypothetical protein